MLKFTKFHGAGNDFILIDDREGTFLSHYCSQFIQHLCHRKFGIGADGLILVQEAIDGADIQMRYFNSDGNEAQMCGNGIRCFGRFLLELGFSPQKTRVSINRRIVELFYIDEKIGVAMGQPQGMALSISTERGVVHFINTGVPHIVHFIDFSLKKAPLQELGPFWRHYPLFAPQGANVNLAALDQGKVRIRTFERGVEGETLACGTGACAVAAIAHALFGLSSPITIVCEGGEMEIQVGLEGLFMVGPALRVFSGIFL